MLEAVTDPTDPSIPDWKSSLRRDFEQWLESLDAEPAGSSLPEPGRETPDLYSLFEQLTVSNTETRKANRRTAEAISQWGETLARFDQTLEPVRASVAEIAATQAESEGLRREHCLVLLEFLDRLRRVGQAFDTPPAPGSWWQRGNDPAWREAWSNQREGFGILVSHLDEFLRGEGVRRIDALGQPYDPRSMVAIAAESRPGQPAGLVIEELAAGYERDGELLRTAQVRITRS